MIYFDHNATTHPLPEVLDYAAQIMQQYSFANPSSIHAFGREAKKVLGDAREQIAALLNAQDYDVIFTSSGTEANNLAINVANINGLLLCATEHESIIKTKKNNSQIAVLSSGALDIKDLQAKLIFDRILVSVASTNNQTGVRQNISEIADVVRQSSGFLHCDIAQSVGKEFVDAKKLGADILTFSSHKIHSIHGCGVLLKRKNIQISPIFSGGGQEYSVRAGTQNLTSALCVAKALSIVNSSSYLDAYQAKCGDLIEYIEKSIVESGGQIIAGQSAKICNTRMASMPGVSAALQMMQFDGAGIAISNGSACSSGVVKNSHVLTAMGINAQTMSETIRISVDASNTMEEAQKFVDVWKRVCRK